MSKKTFKLVLFLLIISGFSFPFLMIGAKEEGRKLEITYPQIPGELTPEYVSVGLPEYVKSVSYTHLTLPTKA